MAEFVIGDYRYTTLTSNNVRAQVVDKTKTTYQDIPSKVTYNNVTYNVTDMNHCFMDCTLLTTSPIIPNNVQRMDSCFYGCTSLTIAPPTMPNRVTRMDSCFRNCASLTIAPVIPNGVTNISNCFRDCTNLEGDVYVYAGLNAIPNHGAFYNTTKQIIIHSMNDDVIGCQALAKTANNNNVYVNVHPEEEITFVDTEMKYENGDKTETLSLQTNANLVQCEIPDLVNGGTITTNVNDALIDLYKRGVFN